MIKKNHPHLSRRALLAGTTAVGFTGLTADRSAFAKAPMTRVQAPAFYRFELGAFELTVLSDGPLHFGPPQGGVFEDTSKDEMMRVLTENHLPTHDVTLDQNALLINTGDKLVLIDTGLGIVRMMGEDSGRLLANLKAAGVDPKDVDAVFLTHAHPDHCFGLLAMDASPAFPNAQIYMAQADYDFWTDETKLTHPQLSQMIVGGRRHLLPLRERMTFIKDGQDVLPGIQAIAAPGHTVGHTAFMITSHGVSICNVGDIAHHHIISVETPRKAFSYDTDGRQAVETRMKAFQMLTALRIPLIAYHFPWPGIGHVDKYGDGFRYFPTPMRTVL